MTRDKAKELLPVMQALANGNQIECRRLTYHTMDPKCAWIGTRNPSFNDDYEYRIKPISKYRREVSECCGMAHEQRGLSMAPFTTCRGCLKTCSLVTLDIVKES